jgi:sulfoxide reductase heme-binding subunit YedZ
MGQQPQLPIPGHAEGSPRNPLTVFKPWLRPRCTAGELLRVGPSNRQLLPRSPSAVSDGFLRAIIERSVWAALLRGCRVIGRIIERALCVGPPARRAIALPDMRGRDLTAPVGSVRASSRVGAVNQVDQVRSGPPLSRHVAAVSLTAALMLLFVGLDLSPDRWESLPLSHVVLADTSLVLLCLILMLGPVARFVPRLRPVVPWSRELGIGMFVTAGLHVLILVGEDWDVVPFFGQRTFDGIDFSGSMWTAANWVGLVALGYALVLAGTSNDWSQRRLGRGWKFVQRQTYTLFVLAWLHTAGFVVLGDGHGSSFQMWFWTFTVAAAVAQLAGFAHTVRSPRGPPSHRVPAKSERTESSPTSASAGRWVGVIVLWGTVIIGSWFLANVESAEEKQVAILCERYDELQGLPMAQIRDELIEYVPADEPLGTLGEFIEICQDR